MIDFRMKERNQFRVVIYARCSTKREQSPESQLRELHKYCKAREWTVEHEIVDHGYTGTNDKRPGLKRLLKLARTREIDCIIILKLDRLFRSLKHMVNTLQELDELSVKFISIKDQIDLTTASGRLLVHLLAAFAEFEAALIKERTLIGLDNAVAKGKKLGRPAYKHKDKILELYSEGKSYREIIKELGCSFGIITKTIQAERKSPSIEDDFEQEKTGTYDD